MTRNEFFKQLWKKRVFPILIILGCLFVIRFFFRALNVASEERQFVNMVALGVIVGGLILSIAFLLRYVFRLVVLNIPESIKSLFLKHANKFQIALYVVASGFLLYFIAHFLIAKEYGNLMGLLVVVAIPFISSRPADRLRE